MNIADTLIWRSDTLYQFNTSLYGVDERPEFSRFSGLFRTSSDTLLWTTRAYLDYIINPLQSPYANYRLLNPLRVGDTLSFVFDTVYGHEPNWGNYNWVIMDANSTVVTGYGTFTKCLHLQYWLHYFMDGNDYLLAEEYYAPDTGLVHFIEHPYSYAPGDLGDIVVTYDLHDLQLNP
ncbi:MAG: hypothetical protein V2A56_07615 [bacterium]